MYDRRIAKQVDERADGTIERTERYVYDGEDIALVFDGAGSLENRYLHGPGIDELFADEEALGEILWALTDNQGTVRDWARSDGTIANHVTYDAFGQITGQTSATHEPLYAYTGREWDADAGMYYYRARWYDPAVGRFISEDPIGFEAGDPNLSRYVFNSPTNLVDPSGEEIVPRAIGDTGYYHVYDSDGFVATVSYPRTGRNWDMLRDLAFATAQRIEAAGRTRRIGAIMVNALNKGPELGFRCAFDVLDNVMSAAEYYNDPTLRNALGMLPLVPGGLKKADDLIAGGGFKLGKHGDFPSPRLSGTQSHHGAMSAWMKQHYPGYDPDKAPAILMPTPNHQRTFGVYNTWRAEMKRRMGGTFDWGKVTEADMRALSEKMFDAAQVPSQMRADYWERFGCMKDALSK